MRHLRIIPTVAAVLLMSLNACALIPERAKWAKITRVKTAGLADVARDDRYYQSAVAAINRRDYATALDLLQAARARTPDDVRVLNAFGVVYDKLDRFDLSARYYAQAKALDPNSPIVNGNIAYSLALQARAAAVATEPEHVATVELRTPAAPVPATDSASVRLVAISPNVLRLELPVQATKVGSTAGLTGHALTIINASGRARGAEPVRTELARLGWTAPVASVKDGPRATRTTILYSQASLVAANALARTLPQPTRMVACAQACAGIQLTVGADAASWSFRAASTEQRS